MDGAAQALKRKEPMQSRGQQPCVGLVWSVFLGRMSRVNKKVHELHWRFAEAIPPGRVAGPRVSLKLTPGCQVCWLFMSHNGVLPCKHGLWI